jgi:hypothetical protein
MTEQRRQYWLEHVDFWLALVLMADQHVEYDLAMYDHALKRAFAPGVEND